VFDPLLARDVVFGVSKGPKEALGPPGILGPLSTLKSSEGSAKGKKRHSPGVALDTHKEHKVALKLSYL